MSVNVTNLELKLIQKINSATTELEVLTYQKVLETLRTGSVDVVETYSELPETNVGKLYFVRDENTHYFYTEEYGWFLINGQISFNLWAWGSNSFGKLGDGSTSCRSSPVQEVSSSTDWCQVSGRGCDHSLALKETGTLWGWGCNVRGQIGDGTTSSKCSPVQEISSSTDWCQVSGGSDHSLALKTSGTLWAWGSEGCFSSGGALGDGTTINRSSPVQEVSSSTDWCQVSSGGYYNSLALKTSGTLWAWGNNSTGEIGDGTTICRSSPVQEVSSSTNWCQVSGGGYHSLALKTSGTLWGWGSNGYLGSGGALGDETAICRSSPVQEVSSSSDWCQVSSGGYYSSLALKTSGTLWAWGNNYYGEIGDGTTICRSSPVQEVSSSTDWCQVSGGKNYSLALKTSGTLWAWGSNYGKLGDGTVVSRSSPVQEVSSSSDWCQVSGGGTHSLALKTEVS